MPETLEKALPTIIVLVSVLCLGATTARAQEQGPQWEIGVGVGAVPDYEGSDEYEPTPIGHAHAAWSNGRFIDVTGPRGSGAAPRFRANILRRTGFVFGPVLQVRSSRGDEVDDPRVQNMPAIDTALEIGGFAGLHGENLGMDLTIVGAVKEYRGSLIELAPFYHLALSDRISIDFEMVTTWASSGYHDHYFSVTPAQSAQSGLPVFQSQKGIKDVSGGLELSWRPSGWEHWSFAGIYRYTRLVKHADSSPLVTLVGSKDQLFGGISIVYNN